MMMTDKGGLPMQVLHYSRFEAISAFHKSLRQGDLDAATYWLQVLKDGGAPPGYIVRYLWEIAAEELAINETAVVDYIANCRANIDRLNDYHFYQMVTLFCGAKKWWQCDTSTEFRELRYQHVQAIREAKQFRDIPHFAHDKHTTRGKKLISEGKADRRWEGSWPGMWWRRRAHVLAQQTGKEIGEIGWAEVWDQDPDALVLAEHVEAKVC